MITTHLSVYVILADLLDIFPYQNDKKKHTHRIFAPKLHGRILEENVGNIFKATKTHKFAQILQLHFMWSADKNQKTIEQFARKKNLVSKFFFVSRHVTF